MVKYQMTKEMFNSIIKTRKGEEKKMNPFAYVKKYVNEQFCVKGTVVGIQCTNIAHSYHLLFQN